jgi:hypothetical protein
MKHITPRTPALGAFFIFALYLGSGLQTTGVSAAPALIEVSMDSNVAELNASYNDTSVPVMFNGTIRTNFPGVTVDVFIQASCGSFPAATSPWHVQMRGIDEANFTATITITKGLSINTTCLGPVSVLARTAYTENVYQDSETVAVHIQWDSSPINDTAYSAGPDELNAEPEGPYGETDPGVVAFSVVFFVPLVVLLAFLRRKKIRDRRKK